MSDPRLSIVVATLGRPTLSRTVASMTDAGFAPRNELVVVTDGPAPQVPAMLAALSPATITVREHAPTSRWHHAGAAQRRHGAGVRRLPALHRRRRRLHAGQLRRVRYHVRRNPGLLLMFRMIKPDGETVWRSEKQWGQAEPIANGNVGTPMFVVPNDPGRLGEWGEARGGDWVFIRSTLDRWPRGSIVQVDDTICVCSPDSGRLGWRRRRWIHARKGRLEATQND